MDRQIDEFARLAIKRDLTREESIISSPVVSVGFEKRCVKSDGEEPGSSVRQVAGASSLRIPRVRGMAGRMPAPRFLD